MIKYTTKQSELIDIISNKEIILADGGSRCFQPNQLVITEKGNKKIKDINIEDNVLSYNGEQEEYKSVLKKYTFKTDKKKMIKLTLNNGGEIIGTWDHMIWFDNEWKSLKEIKELYERNIQKNS